MFDLAKVYTLPPSTPHGQQGMRVVIALSPYACAMLVLEGIS